MPPVPTPLGTLQPPSAAYSAGSADPTGKGAVDNLELFVSNIIGAITIVGGLFFVVYFMIAAFNWVTAGGDTGKVQKARDRMTQGALGIIVMVIAYALIGLVGSVLGLDLLQPGVAILKIAP